MSANTKSADDFVFKFQMKTEEVNYSDDFIYTADETGLYWKALCQNLQLQDGKPTPLAMR
jgi:hypothetical protein